MSFILEKILKKKIPAWNEIVFTQEIIDLECKRHKVRLFKDETIKIRGEYTIHQETSFILYRPKLKREELLWTTAHELGHHLLHYPVPHKFSKGLRNRMDREANYFAAIALMPTWLIKQMTFGEIYEEYHYEKELIQIRKEIYEAFKI